MLRTIIIAEAKGGWVIRGGPAGEEVFTSADGVVTRVCEWLGVVTPRSDHLGEDADNDGAKAEFMRRALAAFDRHHKDPRGGESFLNRLARGCAREAAMQEPELQACAWEGCETQVSSGWAFCSEHIHDGFGGYRFQRGFWKALESAEPGDPDPGGEQAQTIEADGDIGDGSAKFQTC